MLNKRALEPRFHQRVHQRPRKRLQKSIHKKWLASSIVLKSREA